jgi:NodT family efflux transporter outer membrane factor (OMF) lipoprotein
MDDPVVAPLVRTCCRNRPRATEPARVRFRPILVGCWLLVSSCIPSLEQNKPREPSRAVPSSFASAAAPSEARSEIESSAQQTWSDFFSDPHLQALVNSALEGNQELNIRLQEIIIAQSEVVLRQGEYLPRLNGGAGAGIDKVGKYTSQGVSDEGHDVPVHLQHYSVGFSASWEVDIWNRLRNAAKAANYRYLSSLEGKNFMVTQLVAEIARSYYELMAFDNQLDVLKRNIELQQSALQIVRLQKEAGRVTELAVQRFEAEVLKNQSRQYAIEQQRVEAENRINFLLGRFPQPVTRDSQNFRGPPPKVVQAGIPAALLDNRPDVRQAALELEAAKLDVKSAKAAFYPSLSIEAGVGFESFNVRHLFKTPESLLYNLAGNLTAPLLNRNAIKAQYYTANAQQLQAIFNYERTILRAFTEVANQLAMIDNLQKGYELQSQQVDKLVQSIDISNILFQSARADYMEVLLTRRDSLEAEIELIETKGRQMQTMVAIYQALGGGWK